MSYATHPASLSPQPCSAPSRFWGRGLFRPHLLFVENRLKGSRFNVFFWQHKYNAPHRVCRIIMWFHAHLWNWKLELHSQFIPECTYTNCTDSARNFRPYSWALRLWEYVICNEAIWQAARWQEAANCLSYCRGRLIRRYVVYLWQVVLFAVRWHEDNYARQWLGRIYRSYFAVRLCWAFVMSYGELSARLAMLSSNYVVEQCLRCLL